MGFVILGCLLFRQGSLFSVAGGVHYGFLVVYLAYAALAECLAAPFRADQLKNSLHFKVVIQPKNVILAESTRVAQRCTLSQ